MWRGYCRHQRWEDVFSYEGAKPFLSNTPDIVLFDQVLKRGKRVNRGVALQRWGTTVKLTQESFPCRRATGQEMNAFVLWAAELTWADIDSWCCIVSLGTVLLKVSLSEGKETGGLG